MSEHDCGRVVAELLKRVRIYTLTIRPYVDLAAYAGDWIEVPRGRWLYAPDCKGMPYYDRRVQLTCGDFSCTLGPEDSATVLNALTKILGPICKWSAERAHP